MKERVCITLDLDLLNRAKSQKINISGICEEGLLRELEVFENRSYAMALEKQNIALKAFINHKNLALEWEDFKLGLVIQ